MNQRHWIPVFALAVVIAVAAAASGPPRLGEVIDAQQQLARDRPEDASVLNDLGNLLALAGQAAEAEEVYRKALELDGERADVRFNLALLLERRGDRRGALREYRRAVELEPEHAWAHYQIGALHERRGQSERAVRAYSRAFALDPELAFPEVNPHVVDSELITQALLRAYDRRRVAADPPLAYSQPSRLALMLLEVPSRVPDEALAETPAAERPDSQARGEGRVLTKEDLGRRGRVGQATPLREVERARRQAGGTRERPAARQIGGTGEREAGDEEADDRRVGGSSPWVQWMEQRRQQEEGEAQPGGGERQQPGQPRPRPGEPSTARLDMVLFPADPAPAR